MDSDLATGIHILIRKINTNQEKGNKISDSVEGCKETKTGKYDVESWGERVVINRWSGQLAFPEKVNI